MKITKRQLRQIIREEKARIAESTHSFDQAADHYVGGVRMSGPGAANVFGAKKRDDRSIAEKVLDMNARQHRDLLIFIIQNAQNTLGVAGLEKAIAEAMANPLREGMDHGSQNVGADVLELASRPAGVSLDELMEKLGSAAFDEVDRLAEEGIVFLDDQEGIVYASGSQPSAGLAPAIRRYTRR